ncbi:MAG: hypothetical protein PHO70_00470 [Candidatus Omnitrophica bacterium]|nr:hypothetical protein [Candidatus Omnitrophota bacterium]
MIKKIIIVILVFGLIYALFNTRLTTRQGVNFVVVTKEIPLYLKALDFFDRHYNYQELVKEIISGSCGENERLLRIFEWTHKTIKMQPHELPIIDDHVWNIIVRGYGTKDQICDVFATLCTYVGLKSFFSEFKNDNSELFVLAFVKIRGQYRVFDPVNGIYLRNKIGEFATIENILNGDFVINAIDKKIPENYNDMIKKFLKSDKVDYKRSFIQSPLNRFIYEVKKWTNQK